MWFVAWVTMLGGFGVGFSLPRDHKAEVRVELHDKAFQEWEAKHPEVESKPHDAKQNNDEEAFDFTISDAELTKAAKASGEYEHVQALARAGMIVGIVGAVFFVVLVITAGIKEAKQAEASRNATD